MIPTKRIDRTFDGVGRIARFSGTTDAKTFSRIGAMLSGLFNVGRLDVLEWVRDGVYTPLEVLYHWERGTMDKLRGPDAVGGLVAALWQFQRTHEASESYRADIATSIRHIEKYAKKASVVSDLPALLRKAKEKMLETPVAFNRLRSHMLGFVSEVHGAHSSSWIAVTSVKRFKKAEGQRPQKKLRRPLTVAELDAVCAVFEDVPIYGGRRGAANTGKKSLRRTVRASDLALMATTLATTGMRPAEYWERGESRWVVRSDFIDVQGTKTPAAKRPTCLLSFDHTTRAVCGEALFRREFAKATEKALRVGLDTYSLRRTFAKLCEDAGVVESRREAYMGHGPKTVGDLYLKTNVLPFVHEDAAKVSAWIAAERARAAARPTLKLEAK